MECVASIAVWAKLRVRCLACLGAYVPRVRVPRCASAWVPKCGVGAKSAGQARVFVRHCRAPHSGTHCTLSTLCTRTQAPQAPQAPRHFQYNGYHVKNKIAQSDCNAAKTAIQA